MVTPRTSDSQDLGQLSGVVFRSMSAVPVAGSMGSDTLNVASYVPSRVIRHYETLVEEDKQPPKAEHITEMECVLVVADISGFTALSKYLLETKGKDGPDLTSQCVQSRAHRHNRQTCNLLCGTAVESHFSCRDNM